jgi:hypothetical protein
LRYWMAAFQELTAKVHKIIRTTIGQYYVNKALTQGLARANIQPGSVTNGASWSLTDDCTRTYTVDKIGPPGL